MNKKMLCSVLIIKSGQEVNLGEFPMLPNGEIGGHWFDYFALAEDLVNRGLTEDGDEATRICEYIERKYNEDSRTEGYYLSSDGTVTVMFSIVPAAA